MVSFLPRSQTAHCGVKIEIYVSLWLLFKVQSGEILLGVNTSIMNEKIWRKKIEFAKPKILTQRRSGVMHTAESNFFNFVIGYLSEIKTEFENILAFLSRVQMGSNRGK